MLIITERNLKKFGNDDIETLVYDTTIFNKLITILLKLYLLYFGDTVCHEITHFSIAY